MGLVLALPSFLSFASDPAFAITPTCPPGTTFDSGLNECTTTPSCPSGTSYAFTIAMCFSSNCPDGTSFDFVSSCSGDAGRFCPSNTSFSTLLGLCTAPGPSNLCPPGTTFDQTRRECEARPSCPPGTGQAYQFCIGFGSFTYEAPPSCPTGTSFDAAAFLCVAPASLAGTEVPEFPAGMAIVFMVLVPVLLLLRSQGRIFRLA
jgi:hypothetical protein